MSATTSASVVGITFHDPLPSSVFREVTISGGAADLEIFARDCCIRDDVVEVYVDGCQIATIDSRGGTTGSHHGEMYTVSLAAGTHTIEYRNTISEPGDSGWQVSETIVTHTGDHPLECAPDCSMVESAERIRDRILDDVANGGMASVSCDEYNVLFAAVEERTGVPARILKAYAFGEGIGNYYVDQCPRHFLEADLRTPPNAPLHELCGRFIGDSDFPLIGICPTDDETCPQQQRPAWNDQFNVQLVHTAVGEDGGSLGLGIMQVTFTDNHIVRPMMILERPTIGTEDDCSLLEDPFPPFDEDTRVQYNPVAPVQLRGPYPYGTPYDLRLCRPQDGCLDLNQCQGYLCNNANFNAVDQERLVKDPLYNILVGAQMIIYKSYWRPHPSQAGKSLPKTDLPGYFDEANWEGYGRIVVAGETLRNQPEDSWLLYAGQAKGSYDDCEHLHGDEWFQCQANNIRSEFQRTFVSTPATPICQ